MPVTLNISFLASYISHKHGPAGPGFDSLTVCHTRETPETHFQSPSLLPQNVCQCLLAAPPTAMPMTFSALHFPASAPNEENESG
eukprot:1146653-Pelagomonas_calceolata.AAC.7